MEGGEIMKRYRFLSNTFLDFTRNMFKDSSLPPQFIQHEREQLKSLLTFKYGEFDINNKLTRYLEFDPPNMCIITEYLDLLHAIADSYILGSYYPAITGACSLGERIFNIIIIRLRDYFKSPPFYKDLYAKDSFQDWDKAITVLAQWNVIDSQLEKEYRSLAILRNESIHFGSIGNIRGSALTALKTVMTITDKLFGWKGDYIFWCPGETYVKKQKETEPFIKEFILPNCVLLGYKNKIVQTGTSETNAFTYQDYDDYENTQVSDEEFRRLRIEWNTRKKKELDLA
jgi:hypothetical protein